MKLQDPNLERTELVAAALGPLREQLVFVGGCAAGLLITDPAAAPIRATLDVDLVVHASALAAYYRVEEAFTKLGFRRDMTRDAPLCRWTYRNIEVDLMPAEPGVLGFSNRWYPLAVATARPFTLPSGGSIQLIAAPAFLGTKFEAFADRGQGDILASHDLEDIVNVVDGRGQILDEVAQAPAELRKYLAAQCAELLATANFEDYLPGHLQDDSSGERTDRVLERLQAIASRDA